MFCYNQISLIYKHVFLGIKNIFIAKYKTKPSPIACL